MALTTSSWDRPIQGISQQPPKVRLGGQCTRQENAFSSAVNGLVKRPGTTWINDLTGALPDNTKYYYYNRGTSEEYFVCIPPNSLPRVFDVEGDELVVEDELPTDSYVSVPNPEGTLKLSTISDFTFIANNQVVPTASGAQTASLVNIAIINVQFADYGRSYIVVLDGQEVVNYTTPDGSSSGHIDYIGTNDVARYLIGGTTDEAPASGTLTGIGVKHAAGFTAYQRGNTIVVQKTDGSPFSVETRDDADGRDLFVIKNSAKSVGELPLFAPDGYYVEIVGDGDSNDDNYWLQAESVSGDTVKWVESRGPSQSVGFENSTMPCVLIRDRFELGKAVFKLREGPWEERKVGDNDSNPFPSFVQDASPITSIGTFQNRLYVTAGEAVVFSRSNFFFDFFRRTVRSALDDAPVDVFADTNQVNLIENSAILDGDLVFFSQNGQFIIFGDEPLTKANATLRYASTFENIADCQPVVGGDVIFFAFEYGRFSGIREFYTDSLTDTKRARPVTDHVDEYILGNARLLATSTNRNQLFVLAESETEIYSYEFLWQGTDRVQSSWSKWVFDGKVKHIAYDNETVYLLIERAGQLSLERILTGDPDDNGVTFPVRLDRRFEIQATRTNGDWTATLPYPIDENTDLALVRGENTRDAGVTIPYSLDPDGLTVTILDDLADEGTDTVSIIGGLRFTLVYEPTMPFIRDRNGKVIEADRLILNDVSINYDKTGQTRVIVESNWGSVREYEFNGRVIGGSTNLVGFAPLAPGNFSFPVRQEADRVTFRLETNSHLPFQLRDMEWRGRFHQRGRRV